MIRFNAKTLQLLFVALLLAGCAAVERPSPASSSDQPEVALALPSPAPTEPPTSTATPVVTPTPIATATPTRRPTATATPTPQAAAIQHVVIITIDGLRPDALELAETPNLDALRRAGAYQPAAKAVLPSVTLVNHASILGGMAPAKHGIDWNALDPERGVINGPTLFSVAHDAGLSTAMVVGKDKFKHLVLPHSVDQYSYAGFLDVQVAEQAIELINAGLPDVLFIHLPDVDSAGHLLGWMSPGQLLAVANTDGVVGNIIAALEEHNYLDNTLLIITSDHGGTGTAHGSDSPEDTTVPWLAVGPGVPAGRQLTTPITAYDTAATALFALKLPIPPIWDGRPVREIFH